MSLRRPTTRGTDGGRDDDASGRLNAVLACGAAAPRAKTPVTQQRQQLSNKGTTDVVLFDPALLRPVVPSVPDMLMPDARRDPQLGPGGRNPANKAMWDEAEWHPRSVDSMEAKQEFAFRDGVYSGEAVGGVPSGFGTLVDTIGVPNVLSARQIADALIRSQVKVLANTMQAKSDSEAQIEDLKIRMKREEISLGKLTRERNRIRAEADEDVEAAIVLLKTARAGREALKDVKEEQIDEMWESLSTWAARRKSGVLDQNAFTTWLLKRRDLWSYFNAPSNDELTVNEFRGRYLLPAFLEIDTGISMTSKMFIPPDGIVTREEFTAFFRRLASGDVDTLDTAAPPLESDTKAVARREYEGMWVDGESFGVGRLTVEQDSVGKTEMAGIFSEGYAPLDVDINVDNFRTGNKFRLGGLRPRDGRLVSYNDASGELAGRLKWKLLKGQVRFAGTTELNDGGLQERAEIIGMVEVVDSTAGSKIVGNMDGSMFIGKVKVTAKDGTITEMVIDGYDEDGTPMTSDVEGRKPSPLPKSPRRKPSPSPQSPRRKPSPSPQSPPFPSSPKEPPPQPPNEPPMPPPQEPPSPQSASSAVHEEMLFIGMGFVMLSAAEIVKQLIDKRNERMRLDAERLENERLDAERLENERWVERRRLERQRLQAERLERQRLEAARLENERRLEEAERLREAERLERLKLTNSTIRDAVQYVLKEGGANYRHPRYELIADWDVSEVTDMSSLFRDATSFNGDLKDWKFPNVTHMTNMFSGATSFKGDGVSGWKFPKVVDMSKMFDGATSFDGRFSADALADLRRRGVGIPYNYIDQARGSWHSAILKFSSKDATRMGGFVARSGVEEGT